METLANRIDQTMKERGFSQDQLAEKSGVTQTTIHKLTTGKALESRKLSNIADALGVNTDWLAKGKGNKYAGRVNESDGEYDLIARPPVIDEEAWKALHPQTRAFFEVFLNKSASGQITLDHVKLMHNLVDELIKD
jgi:transcriptional regulator with XRE-family HTH domain